MRVLLRIVAAVAVLLLVTACTGADGSEEPGSPSPGGTRVDGAASPTPDDPSTPTPTAAATPSATEAQGTPTEDVAVAVDVDGRVVVLDAETGEEVRELLDGVRVDDPADNDVTVSPDSTEVVVAVPPQEPGGESELAELAIEGGEPQVVAQGSSPALSPDGETLAYISLENGTGHPEPVLVLLDRDSGEETRLRREQPFTYIADVAWTSDGAQVVFTAGEIRTGLYAVERDATDLDEARRLGPDLEGEGDETSWGPVTAFGSARLAVVETCCGVPRDDRWQVLAVDVADGTTQGDLLPEERTEATHLDSDDAAERLLVVVRGGPGGGPLLRWDGEGDAEQIADGIIVAAW